jgi:Zn-dependent protease with chaperone function
MNFFEQQDRSRQATKTLLGLFSVAVLFICLCVYFGVMVTINNSGIPFGQSCQPPLPVSSTVIPAPSPRIVTEPIGSTDSIPLLPTVRERDYQLKGWGGGSRSFGSSRNSSRNWSDRTDSSNRVYVNSTGNRTRSGITNFECKRSVVWWDTQIFFGTFTLTASMIGLTSWWKIHQLQAGGAVIAMELGGRRVLPEIATLAELQLLNIVEEMAIAATIAVPSVYILDGELGINSFAAGFTVNDAVIGVTKGSLDRLSRDELQGAIAHEFSHILNGDMTMNIRLTGLLHGILSLYLMGRILSCMGSDRNPLTYLGFLLMVIGSSGCLAGRLIQGAISRQRELLADASAVQFTRNPEAVASAMAKTSDFGSYLSSPYANTNNHMFFAPAIDLGYFDGLFSAHPPFAQRTQIIKGSGQKLGKKIVINGETVPTFNPIIRTDDANNQEQPDLDGGNAQATPSAATGEYATLAYLYALLLHPDRSVEQLDYLQRVEEPAVIEQIEKMRLIVKELPPQQRLIALDRQVTKIRDTLHAPRLLRSAAGIVDILADDDWQTAIIYLILTHRLTPTTGQPQIIYHSIEDVWIEMLNLLGSLARLTSRNQQEISYGFETSLMRLPANLTKQTQLPPAITWREFQTDLIKVAAANLKVKQTLIAAGLEILMSQRQLAPAAADLMRSIAICLDCPIPPLLDRLDRSPAVSSRS